MLSSADGCVFIKCHFHCCEVISPVNVVILRHFKSSSLDVVARLDAGLINEPSFPLE